MSRRPDKRLLRCSCGVSLIWHGRGGKPSRCYDCSELHRRERDKLYHNRRYHRRQAQLKEANHDHATHADG